MKHLITTKYMANKGVRINHEYSVANLKYCDKPKHHRGIQLYIEVYKYGPEDRVSWSDEVWLWHYQSKKMPNQVIQYKFTLLNRNHSCFLELISSKWFLLSSIIFLTCNIMHLYNALLKCPQFSQFYIVWLIFSSNSQSQALHRLMSN